MKRLFLTLITTLFFIASFAQTIRVYTFEVDISNITGSDTTFQPETFPDVSGYGWSITIEVSDLDALDGEFSFGSSNIETNTLTHIYQFEEFNYDSIPFVIDTTNMFANENGKRQQSFRSVFGNWGFPKPIGKLTKNSLTSGDFKAVMRYFKK